MQKEVSSSDEGPVAEQVLPAHMSPLNIVNAMRLQARTFKDLPPWPGLKFIPRKGLSKQMMRVLDARETRSRRQAAEALGLSFLEVRTVEKAALKIAHRILVREVGR